MNIYDAAKVLNLHGDITPEVTKSAYREACKKYHPDINPAGEEMMKIINEAFQILKDHKGYIDKEKSETDYDERLNQALNSIFPLSGLIIEVCGIWVWVTGDTFKFKTELKEAGFKWANKKKAWYFRPEKFKSRSSGDKSLEEIREKYGSKKAYGEGFKKLGAAHA